MTAMSTKSSSSTDISNRSEPDTTQKCPSPPFVTVAGVPNFRDVGGKTCSSRDIEPGQRHKQSRTICAGYLFRCAQPTHITEEGQTTMRSKLGIRDVFDLRSFKELRLMAARYPDAPLDIPGIRRHHVPIYMDEDYTPISLAEKYNLTSTESKDAKTNRGSEGEGYVQAYADILTQAARSGASRTILQHILQHPDRPLAVHCTAGKDRTGIFAALVLKLCGVSEEDIVTDYAYTTHGLGKWREHLIRRLMEGAGQEYKNPGDAGEAEPPPPPTREEAERIVASHPEHMRGFLDEVLERQFGGARVYCREYCGFSDDEVDVIVRHLTVESV